MEYEKIYNELEKAIFGIVLKHQDEIGITSGDEYVDFTLTIKLLARQILHTLIYQAYSNDAIQDDLGVFESYYNDYFIPTHLDEDLKIEEIISGLVVKNGLV